MPGLFITFEGPEGCGKSTQVDRLATRLRDCGCDVVQARDPGGTLTGEAIRELVQHGADEEGVTPEAELLLFAASRAQLVRQVIRPALAHGAVVICDRFVDSSLAYQGYGRQSDLCRIQDLNAWATDDLVPDVTLLLDLEVTLGAERIQKRNAANGVGADRFEREACAFHERVRQGYLALAKRWPDRFRVIAADQSEDAISESVWCDVEPLLNTSGAEESMDAG